MSGESLKMSFASEVWAAGLANLGRFTEQEPMSRHTTLVTGGPARWFFRPASRANLLKALAEVPEHVRILPLGRGSNMLLPDSGFDGLIIDLSELNALHIEGCMVFAEAGARMSSIARQCAEHGLTGLEFMATVPGDLGGGIAMNAGAFSQQVSDTLTLVDLAYRDGTSAELPAGELSMSYRHTDLPRYSLVLGAHFELSTDAPDAIRERMRAMRSRRSSTQPLNQPNCGSVFKNPEGDHAARLIEAAGLKGTQIGGAHISERHANFIVNDGDASSADILALIDRVRLVVNEKFGVLLEPEVRIIQDSAESEKQQESAA
ncbi:MAG TPA: UDP-N-acetylmuramate dehydrogenase [Mariprofundaceae bacterium]|nr:UDP-N-acetylmuramate dehydrogenase [Mariprofundaceae bacterium]